MSALFTFRVSGIPNEQAHEFTWDFEGMTLTEAAAAFTSRGDEAIRRAWALEHPGWHITDAQVAERRIRATVRNGDPGAVVTV